jgi:hypothetical protein
MSESEAWVSDTTVALGASFSLSSAPSRVLTRYVSPSTRSMVPRTRTVSCAHAKGVATATPTAIIPSKRWINARDMATSRKFDDQ